jgi:phosphatidylglycerol:prolipoprotein diacylglycerol transferase
MDWWNHIPQHINPNILEIGSFKIRYYGLMYAVAFAITYLLVLCRLKKEPLEFSKALIQKYFVWAMLALMVGARLGFVLFYDLVYFVEHPLKIVWPFDNSGGFHYIGILGMSYHGGLLAVVLVTLIFCYKNNISFWRLTDLLSPAIPLGYTFGRIGNFLNGELYGRVTTISWGMYFPSDLTGQLRHPSQLYEAFFEGIFLFVILWSIRKKRIFDGFHFCLYIIGYGVVRFFIEYVREPDPGLGSIFNLFTMGQLLCIAMVLTGIIIVLIRKRNSTGRLAQDAL